jgi:hypothetical protein
MGCFKGSSSFTSSFLERRSKISKGAKEEVVGSKGSSSSFCC